MGGKELIAAGIVDLDSNLVEYLKQLPTRIPGTQIHPPQKMLFPPSLSPRVLIPATVDDRQLLQALDQTAVWDEYKVTGPCCGVSGVQHVCTDSSPVHVDVDESVGELPSPGPVRDSRSLRSPITNKLLMS